MIAAKQREVTELQRRLALLREIERDFVQVDKRARAVERAEKRVQPEVKSADFGPQQIVNGTRSEEL